MFSCRIIEAIEAKCSGQELAMNWSQRHLDASPIYFPFNV